MNHMLLRKIYLIGFVMLMAFNVFASNKCQDVFVLKEIEIKDNSSIILPTLEQVNQSKNLSQLARSNAKHFWIWAKMMANNLHSFKKKQTEYLKKLLSFDGIIMGDAHLGNIHRIFDYIKGKLKWKNIDLDDAGKGSYFLDFVHLVLTAKVVGTHNIKTNYMVDAYNKGLNGKDMKVPESIKEFTEMTPEEFEKKRQAYVEKKITNDGKFKLTEELIKFDSQLIKAKSREEVEVKLKKNFGNDIIISDLALVLRERGGGNNIEGQIPLAEGEIANKRIWALLEINGIKHIYEIKGKGESGLNGYQKQESIIEIFNLSRDFFGYSDKELFLVEIGDTIYYVREKKITLFDVPYDQKNKKEVQLLRDLANWGAYWLGKWHAQNLNSVEYIEFVNENIKTFSTSVKVFREFYQEILEEALKEKKKNKKKD